MANWDVFGNAGVNSPYILITPYSGTYFGYVRAGAENVWQTLERTFTDAVSGSVLTGVVGFYDTDSDPNNDEGKLLSRVSISQGGAETVVKSWSAADGGAHGFRGWESFTVIVPGDGEVTIKIQVRNIADSSFSSAVVLDHINVCFL